MRYVVSDIHGNYELFVKLLKKINFSKNDEMFILGDVIDKGKDVQKLLNLIYNSKDQNIFTLTGNHELDFIDFVFDEQDRRVGDKVLIEDCKKYLGVQNLTMEDIDNICHFRYYYEEDDFVLVHAGIKLKEDGTPVPLEETDYETFVYDRTFKNENVLPKNYKCVIFGHTPTCFTSGMKGKIIKYQKPNTVGDKVGDYYKIQIDTGNYLTGILGCLRLDDMKEFYVNEFED